MKVVTKDQFEGIFESIFDDREEQAKLLGQSFNGLLLNDVLTELSTKLGIECVIQKNPPRGLTKEDIKSVADGRFYRKTGIKILLWTVIILLMLSMCTTTFRLIPLVVYYGLCGVLAFGFTFIYGKKQAKARREFRETYGMEKEDEEE
jgi:hypothetical protein